MKNGGCDTVGDQGIALFWCADPGRSTLLVRQSGANWREIANDSHDDIAASQYLRVLQSS